MKSIDFASKATQNNYEITMMTLKMKHENPCNWDSHFQNMMDKANSRLHILRICKYYGYTLEELTILFHSLIMSVFTYAIEVWACAYGSKYLSF